MKVTIEIRRPAWMTPSRLRRARPLLLLVLALVFVGPVLATDRFGDVEDGNPHHNDISLIAAVGITQGCNPPVNDMYCPADVVTRQQMGSFLARAAGLGANPPVTNATLLDGLDSTALQRRVTGTCAAGSMVSAVNANGTVTCAADDVDGGDADTLDGMDSAAFQRRVTGTCAAGSMVSAVNANGTVTCAADDVDGGDADTLDGMDSTDFYADGAKVADSDLLDGFDSTDFYGSSSKVDDSELVDGYSANEIIFVAFAESSAVTAMTTTPTTYVTLSITAPNAGFVKLDASFTAFAGVADACWSFARLRLVSPEAFSLTQRETTSASGGNIALTHVFPVAEGPSTFELQVWSQTGCTPGTEAGQLSAIYTPFEAP